MILCRLVIRTDRKCPRRNGKHSILCERGHTQRGSGLRKADVSRFIIDARPGKHEGQLINLIGVNRRRCIQREELENELYYGDVATVGRYFSEVWTSTVAFQLKTTRKCCVKRVEV